MITHRILPLPGYTPTIGRLVAMRTAAEPFARRATHGLVAFAALASLLSVAACGQEQFAAEAEARARRWGIPAAEIVHNVVYAEYGQRRLLLDLYLPPNRDPAVALPGVIAVRGGGWQAGDKEFFGYIAGQLAMEKLTPERNVMA